MILARVLGNIVATKKNLRYEGASIMLCQQVTPEGDETAMSVLALNAVDAGVGDTVLIVQSVGVSSRLKGKLASLPRHQKTSSPIPAPTESTATSGFPFGCRSLFKVCTTSSLRPSSESFLTVATTVPMTRASCIRLKARGCAARHCR